MSNCIRGCVLPIGGRRRWRWRSCGVVEGRRVLVDVWEGHRWPVGSLEPCRLLVAGWGRVGGASLDRLALEPDRGVAFADSFFQLGDPPPQPPHLRPGLVPLPLHHLHSGLEAPDPLVKIGHLAQPPPSQGSVRPVG